MKVEVEDLGVRYGRQIAVDGVSLAAMPGEILGVLGPNGSGKSSLVKAIAGVLPHRGTVRFDGLAERPSVIGYMPQAVDAAGKSAIVPAVGYGAGVSGALLVLAIAQLVRRRQGPSSPA